MGLDQVLTQVQARYARAETLTARFTQQDAYAVGGGLVQKGTVALKHPGRMRWDYAEPNPRLFVSDGKELWMWTPHANQAVRYGSVDPRTSARILDFLRGMAGVREDFQVSLGTAEAGAVSLVLVPRSPDAGYGQLTLAFDRDDLDLRRAVLVDAVGNVSTTTFSDVRLGAKVDDSRFRFTPPKGAEVVDMP